MDYQKLYSDLISFRKLNPLKQSKDLYTEEHHIIPSCMGGSDSPENLVRLTAREHFIVHRLLSKIYPDNARLAYAILFMSRLQNRKIYSREYDRLKDLASKDTKQRWEDPVFREMVTNANSKMQTERWKDPIFREIMSSRFKRLWADPEFREMMVGVSSNTAKQRWEDPEFKAMMTSHTMGRWEDPSFREMMSSCNKQLWEDPEFKAMMTSHTIARWADPEFKRKIKKSCSDWFEERKGQPWLMPGAHKTRNIWSLAQVFWEHRPNNPSATEIYSAEGFCRIFNEGKNVKTFAKMLEMFKKNGWVPREDKDWIKEFGHISY